MKRIVQEYTYLHYRPGLLITEVAPKLKFEKNVVEVTDTLQVCLAIRLTGRPVLRGSDSGRSEFQFLKNHSASTQSEYLLSMIPASSSYLWTISRMCRSSKFGDVYPDTIMMSPSLSTSVQQIHRWNSIRESRLIISFFEFNQKQRDWQNLNLVLHERNLWGCHTQLWWAKVIFEDFEPLDRCAWLNGGAF